MLDFYTNKLGLKLQFVMKTKKQEDFGYYLAAGDLTFIEIFDAKKAHEEWGESPNDRYDVNGKIRHFCLEVENVDSLAVELKKKGITVTNIKNGIDGSRQGWIVDPDENWIELMHYTRESLQLKN